MITLQHYLIKFETEHLAQFSPERQQELYRDLLRLVALIREDRDARKIQAIPRIIRKHLSKIKPAQMGLDKRSYQNFCSNIRVILKQVSIDDRAYQYVEDLPKPWQDLLNSDVIAKAVSDTEKPVTKHAKINLNAFAKKMVGCGVMDPADIRENCFFEFIDLIVEYSFKKNPETTFRDQAVTWNRFYECCENWPGEKILLPNKRDFTLPLEALHPNLQAEIASYIDYMRDPIKKSHRDGAYKLRNTPYSKGTITIHQTRLRYAAACLVQKGKKLSELREIIDLVHPDSIAVVSEVYRERKQAKLRAMFKDGISSHEFLEKTSGETTILKGLRTICNNCYEINPAGRMYMASIVKSAQRARYDLGGRIIEVFEKGKGFSLKDQEAIEAIYGDKEKFKEYLELSRVVMDGVEEKRKSGGKLLNLDYYEFQNAFGLAILQICVMRPGDLARLNLEEHFQRTPRSKKHAAKLVYREQKKFNHEGSEVERFISELTDKYIQIYLEHYRPFFLKGQSSDYLFPGENPIKPITTDRLASRISRFVERELGVSFNCHLNRKITGTHIVDTDPKNIYLASKIMNHSSMKTTETYYLPDQTAPAFETLDGLVGEVSEDALR